MKNTVPAAGICNANYSINPEHEQPNESKRRPFLGAIFEKEFQNCHYNPCGNAGYFELRCIFAASHAYN